MSTAVLPNPSIVAQGIELFRAGRQKDSNGVVRTWTTDQLQNIATAYNRVAGRLHDAPAVTDRPIIDPKDPNAPIQIGHNSEISYGWLTKAYVDGDTLKGDYADVDPKFADMVNSGRLRKRSISFYPPGHDHNPTPHSWNIRHVSYVPVPAVKGLADHRFAEGECEPVVITDIAHWLDNRLSEFDEDDTCQTYNFEEEPSMKNGLADAPIAIDFGDMPEKGKKHGCEVGCEVSWMFGKNKAMGKIVKMSEAPMTVKLKGKDITRNGTPEDPALLIEQGDGTQILKLSSEMEQIEEMPADEDKQGDKKSKKKPETADMAESDMIAMSRSSSEVLAMTLTNMREQAIAAGGIEAADKLYPKEAIARLMQLAGEDSRARPEYSDIQLLQQQLTQLATQVQMLVRREISEGEEEEGEDEDEDEKPVAVGPVVPAYAEADEASIDEETPTPQETPMTQATATAPEFTDQSEKIVALEATIAAQGELIKGLQAANAASFAERERSAATTFVDGLIIDRKVRPCDKAQKVQLLMSMPNIDPLNFGEGDEAVQMTARKAVMNEMAAGPALWSAEALPTGPGDAPEFAEVGGVAGATPDSVRQHQAIVAKVKEMGGDPNDATDYAEGMNSLGIAY
jgi:Hypervirulence associated proteins TUDOR domain